MQFFGLNIPAVLLAAVAGYAFGAVYYMALAKPWMAAVGKSEAEIRSGTGIATYVVTFIAQLVMAAVFTFLLDNLGPGEVRTAITAAVLIWLGFVLTTLVVNHGFQGAKRSLTVIDAGHWLGVLLIQGVVIGLMRSGVVL